jgi:hypothetical protein
MVDIAVETIEPDPSATSIENNQTVNTSENAALPEAPKETLGMYLVLPAYRYYKRPHSTTDYPNG